MAASLSRLSHDHVFLGVDHKRNERKVWLVVALTTAMMVVEIAAGTLYGSMALVADGWHMSTHACAMIITALAYFYSRRLARDPRFTFGTGKLGDLAGFASAIVLALIALLIGWDSLLRLTKPIAIHFDQAIAVAALGLVVNLASAWLLKDDHAHHEHDHHHSHRDGQDHGKQRHGDTAQDNNLRAAYLHVLADALTSILAIAALFFGKSYGWLWADPFMGIVGAVIIARWSWDLMRDAGGILLDRVPNAEVIQREVREEIEVDDDRITDLHVWKVGPENYAAIISLLSSHPKEPDYYKSRLVKVRELAHVTVEVNSLEG